MLDRPTWVLRDSTGFWHVEPLDGGRVRIWFSVAVLLNPGIPSFVTWCARRPAPRADSAPTRAQPGPARAAAADRRRPPPTAGWCRSSGWKASSWVGELGDDGPTPSQAEQQALDAAIEDALEVPFGDYMPTMEAAMGMEDAMESEEVALEAVAKLAASAASRGECSRAPSRCRSGCSAC